MAIRHAGERKWRGAPWLEATCLQGCLSARGGGFSGRGHSLDVEAMAHPQWLSVGQAGTAVGPSPHFSLSFGTGRKQGLAWLCD